ncbi:TPA: hypothetical protein ACH3X1_012298 [Trebouxia sp. C0004]
MSNTCGPSHRARSWLCCLAGSVQPSVQSVYSLPRQQRYNPEAYTGFPFDPLNISSLSTSLQHKTKLSRQASMSISLWKEVDTSTDEERDAHLRKFHLRFQKLRSGEIKSNASVALNDYERWSMEVFEEIRPIDSLDV